MTDVPVSEISLSRGEEKDLVLLPVSTTFSGHMDLDTYFLKKIRSTGEINESDHSSVQSTETIVNEASFRGRHLLGKELCVPEGYQGVILEEKTGKLYREALPRGDITPRKHVWEFQREPSPSLARSLPWPEMAPSRFSCPSPLADGVEGINAERKSKGASTPSRPPAPRNYLGRHDCIPSRPWDYSHARFRRAVLERRIRQ